MKNISLTQMSVPEFRNIIRQEIERAQTDNTGIPDRQRQPEGKEILGVEGAADFLGLKRSAVYQKTHAGTIPYFKKGKKLYFRRSELLDWLESGRQKTVDQEMDDMDFYLNKQNQ